MRILGIDPGSHIVGYGLIDFHGGNRYTAGHYGTIQIPSGTPAQDTLLTIYDDMRELLGMLQPDLMVIEQLFFFRNVTTVMSVAQARGVILLTAKQSELPFAEYTPMQVKMTLTGHGRASKREVQEMVKELLGLEQIPRPDDAADALALAITHAHFIG